ncbi:DUF5329 domain-containing protein [Congregibacter sp.]|uniref:DUF5329 domain-containing protein n=1 Tax=Congregibacter sp. TaxID=2744308 RepID=UPI003F6D7378
MIITRPLLLPALLWMLASFSAELRADPATPADREITYLINSVEESGCLFMRNGDEHQATDAADHLRLKYRRGKRYAKSADQFIERLASESSWTGKPYFINCPGSPSVTSRDWLSDELERYRQSEAM